jgi:predicted ribosomally synthesized peptide with SipW-like signal peptide
MEDDIMNKKKVLIAAFVLALVLSIGGVLAYFSDSETKTNTFTVGKVRIELNETAWDTTGKTAAESVLPNQMIDKNPTIKNTGNNAAYVFIKVSIPKANVTIEAQDGSGSTTSPQQLFTLINSSNAAGINSGWELVSSVTTGTDVNEYIYSYSSGGTMTSLATGTTTPSLFDKIQFVNAQEGWGIEGQNYNVVVTGYAIQTENLTADNVTGNTAVWNVLNANAVHKTQQP